MFRTLCFEYRLIDIKYFLDELQQWEAAELIQNIEYVDRNERELIRYQLYAAIQPNIKKRISLKDVFSLPWDKKHHDEYDEEMDKRLEEEAKSFADLLNSGKIKIENTEAENDLFKNIH